MIFNLWSGDGFCFIFHLEMSIPSHVQVNFCFHLIECRNWWKWRNFYFSILAVFLLLVKVLRTSTISRTFIMNDLSRICYIMERNEQIIIRSLNKSRLFKSFSFSLNTTLSWKSSEKKLLQHHFRGPFFLIFTLFLFVLLCTWMK